jgi:hypothetical protein
MALAHHLCIRLVNNALIAPSAWARRVLSRAILARARDLELLAFSLADNHLHLLVACLRVAAGELARTVELSLGRNLPLDAGFSPALIKPVEDGWHLDRCFRYVLRQPERHGIGGDPLREASNLPDLLGLRPLGAATATTVRKHLPRIKRADLLSLLGVPSLDPIDGSIDHVVEATLAASALPSLDGSSREVLVARRAALEVIGRRLQAREVARLLGTGPRMHFRLKQRPVDGALVQAIRQQLHLIEQRRGVGTKGVFEEIRASRLGP